MPRPVQKLVHPPSAEASAPQGATASAPEPSTYPLREPLPYGSGFTRPDSEDTKEAKEGVCRERREEQESTSSTQPSCAGGASSGEAERAGVRFAPVSMRECNDLAEALGGKPGRSLVARAFIQGSSVAEVWDKLLQVRDDGEEIGRVFWEP
jgi:hypothetical protein